MKYNNPILPGFHPDPSICRVDNDYYLVTSSFEYFPSIPVFHSRDLLHWEQYGHCITKKEALMLRKGFPSRTGIYAPTIRYHKGTFYVVCTNVAYGGTDEGNFFVTSTNPKEGWSDPIHIDTPGIDPSFFFDDDDKVYYTGAAEGKIYIQEIDVTNGKLLSDLQFIWGGTGGNDPEGPHIYKKDNWYYLLISEGGTELGHMITMARSRSITGPYESYEHNPVLSNRSHSTNLKAIGHADLFQDQNANWWAVCLGFRTISYPYKHNLGRETMLAPVIWQENQWPVFADNGILHDTIETKNLPLSNEAFCPAPANVIGCEHFYDDFSSDNLQSCWNIIYNPVTHSYALPKDRNDKASLGIVLYGNQNTIGSTDNITWLGRRQEHHCFTAKTKLTFSPDDTIDEAGLTIYLNNAHHYEIALAMHDGKKSLILRRRIGSLYSIEKAIAYDKESVYLQLTGDKEFYTFAYSENDTDYQTLGKGESAYLTTEVGGYFTGNYIALYCTEQNPQKTKGALFSFYEYKKEQENK